MIERVLPKSTVPWPVLITESPHEFERLRGELNDELKPRGPVERYVVDGIIEKAWGIRRLHRVKTSLINAALRPGLNAILAAADPYRWQSALKPVVDHWCSDERDKKGVLKVVEQAIKLDESAIEAAAVQYVAEDLERLDRLIASLESRLGKDLRLLAELRGGQLGAQLHAKVNRVIDGKVLALDNYSKKPPPAAA